MQTPDAENVAPQVPPHPCDRLGHGCDYCRAVRRLGPREPQNPLARLIPPSSTATASAAEARAARYVQRRKREHARTQVSQLASTYSSYRALLAAVLKAA